MVKVKICGLTRLEDALVALAAGADYLGFIFYPPSPRAITPDDATHLIAQLRESLAPVRDRALAPDPWPLAPLFVGVFVNEPPAAAAAILDRCGLDLAQLSGDEPAADVTDPASPLYGRAYKALRPRSLAEANDGATRCAAPPHSPGPRLLLDTPHGRLYGGTGETGDWGIAAALAARLPGLMLAGGLTPNNVAAAVAAARPFAVDVAGGVESAPGVKDAARVRAFVANAKREETPDYADFTDL